MGGGCCFVTGLTAKATEADARTHDRELSRSERAMASRSPPSFMSQLRNRRKTEERRDFGLSNVVAGKPIAKSTVTVVVQSNGCVNPAPPTRRCGFHALFLSSDRLEMCGKTVLVNFAIFPSIFLYQIKTFRNGEERPFIRPFDRERSVSSECIEVLVASIGNKF